MQTTTYHTHHIVIIISCKRETNWLKWSESKQIPHLYHMSENKLIINEISPALFFLSFLFLLIITFSLFIFGVFFVFFLLFFPLAWLVSLSSSTPSSSFFLFDLLLPLFVLLPFFDLLPELASLPRSLSSSKTFIFLSPVKMEQKEKCIYWYIVSIPFNDTGFFSHSLIKPVLNELLQQNILAKRKDS